ncbi:MAG: hypothetical protein WD270_06365 [Acetobacterales bacterium]
MARNTLDTPLDTVLVDVLARTVPSGASRADQEGADSKETELKVTLALRPLQSAGGGVPLDDWPAAIDKRIAEAEGSAAILVAPIPLQCGGAPRRPNDLDEVSLTMTRWHERSDPEAASGIWRALIPEGSSWEKLGEGLETFRDATKRAPPKGVTCVSGKESDIALLVKMARALEAVHMACAPDPAEAARTLYDKMRDAANGLVKGASEGSFWDTLKTTLASLDGGEGQEQAPNFTGRERDETPGKTGLEVARIRRKLTLSTLGAACKACADVQSEGADICSGKTAQELARTILNQTRGKSCACDHLTGDLNSIYRQLLDLQKEFLLANAMGDAEFAKLETSVKSRDTTPAEYEKPDEAEATDATLTASFAAKRLFNLDETPDLGRLFRTFVDVALDAKHLATALKDVRHEDVAFFYIRLAPADWLSGSDQSDHSAWTLAKVVFDGERIVSFWPATREELVLRMCGTPEAEMMQALRQMDGVLLLGTRTETGVPAYEIVSMDIQAAAREAQSRAERMFNDVYEPDGAQEAAWALPIDLRRMEPTGLSSGGLSVLNFSCASDLSRRIGAVRAITATTCAERALDADDLLVGRLPSYGLLAEVEGELKTVWHLLTGKKVSYGAARLANLADAEPLLRGLYRTAGERALAQASADRSVPQAKRLGGHTDDNGNSTKGTLVARVGEAEFVYLGDPMGIETGLETEDCPIDPMHDLSIDRDITLNRQGEDGVGDGELVGALRFGQPGRVGFRAVYLGGGTLDSAGAEDAFNAVREAALPPLGTAQQPISGRRFLRSEAVAPAALMLPKGEADREIAAYRKGWTDDYPRQSSKLVVLRSEVDQAGTVEALGPRHYTRIVMPPVLPLDMAEMHGVFDDVRPTWYQTPDPQIDHVDDIPPWRTAYHRRAKLWRPRDGLRAMHHDAACGGAPALCYTDDAVADQAAIVSARFDDGRVFLVKATEWSELFEAWSKKGADRGPQPNPPPAPIGDSVFARRSSKTHALGRTVPVYPDPMAAELVMRLSPEGAEGAAVAIETIAAVTPETYPDTMPVAIRVAHGTMGAAPTVKAPKDRVVTIEGTVCREVVVEVPPGRSYVLELWYRPSVDQLVNWSELVDTAATLREVGALCTSLHDPQEPLLGPCGDAVEGEANCGLLGRPAPTPAALRQMAVWLHEKMKYRPVPEIARVTRLEVRHAVTRPLAVPVPTPPAGQAELSFRRVSGARMDDLGKEALSEPKALPRAWYLDGPKDQPVAEEGGTEADLGGYLEVDLGSTGAIEIEARAMAVKGGAFDDPARTRGVERIQTGAYPLALGREARKQKTSEIYGFSVDRAGRVAIPRSGGFMAQFRGLPEATADGRAEGKAYLSLHALFAREAATNADAVKPGADVRLGALFADTRARQVDLTFVAVSRYVSDFKKRATIRGDRFVPGADYAPKMATRSAEVTRSVWLPASERPAQPVPAAEAHPVIQSAEFIQKGKAFSQSRRVASVRLWLARPWFTSGEGERLGIVVWPQVHRKREKAVGFIPTGRELFVRPSVAESGYELKPIDWMALEKFEERYMTGAAGFVSRWGSDPTEAYPKPGWRDWMIPNSLFADFRFGNSPGETTSLHPDGRFVPNVAMPIPGKGGEADDDSPWSATTESRQRYLNVDLLTYAPRFDIDTEQWYVDVMLDPGPMVSPFLRLGVVRYQEHAPRDLQVSEPAEPYEFQILTHRTAHLSLRPVDGGERVMIETEVRGPATVSSRDDEASPDLDAQVHSRMYMRLVGREDETGVVRLDAETVVDPDGAKGGLAIWRAVFRVPRAAIETKSVSLKMHLEECAYRPSTRNEESETPKHGQSTRYLCTLVVPDL